MEEKITIKKEALNKFIANIVDKKFNDFIKEWRSEDNVPDPTPAIVTEPAADDPAVIDPKTDEQVHDLSMPIEDKQWVPGNLQELGLAMKQMSDWVPDSEIKWFYPRLKKLIDKCLDRTDEDRMQPRLGIMHNDE